MSLENEYHNSLDQSANYELMKKSKISYTRDLLLSLSELDCCKELPSGFDRSLLSEFEDASQDRQRSTGGLSMHSFRRNEYGSSPPSRGDASSYSRAVHGKWDMRSSGRSDRESDSQSEWDSDSGRHFGSYSRKSLQGPEHDGLLGSGSFPRPSGYTPGLSAPKFRPNSNYQLNRSNEPYHPPRPYKAPHSRRDTNDSYNDETFGSLDDTSEDRVEEERKRRASFELMRKEQHKAFQEMQKFNPDKSRDEFDITSLLDDDEKRPVNRSTDLAEPAPALLASRNDSEKSYLAHAPPASRPLVPPGFTSSVLEKNLAAKSSVSIHPKEDGQTGLEDTGDNNYELGANSENKYEKSIMQADISQQHPGRTGVSANNDKEKITSLSSLVDVPDFNIGMGDQLMERSALSEALEASDDNEVVQLNVEGKGNDTVRDFNVENSNSILEKLFGSALTLGKSPSVVEPDHKPDETWSPHAFQSSKFAHWFDDEEKGPLHEITPRPNDLLSLIVGGENGGLQDLDLKAAQQSVPENPDPAVGHIKSNVAYTISNSEKPCKSDKTEVVPAVLTCEDLEQSILSQISENGSSLEQPVLDKDFDSKIEQLNSNINDNASQHLLSLLQKGTGHKDMDPSAIQGLGSTDKVHETDGVAINKTLDDSVKVNGDISNSSKTLTLETLFGTAFMQELQTVRAPLSVQRGEIESSGVNVSGPLKFPFSVSDNGLPSTGAPALNRLESQGLLPSEIIQKHKSNRLEEKWLGYDDPQGAGNSSQLGSEFSKVGGVNGPTDFQLPEEDSLISVNDPLQNFIATSNSGRTKSFQDTPVDIAGKLAALNSVVRGERTLVGNQECLAYSHGPYDMSEPGISYQNLNVQQASPQFHPSQLDHMGPIFNQLDSHSPHISSYMRIMTPEGMVHHDSPPNHQFPGNMFRPPFHQPSTGLTGLDSPAHHSMLQQIPMQGNFPPSQLLRGFPRGAPPPVRPGNPMSGFMQEPKPLQGLPFNSHQQPTFGGPGMPHQAPDVAGARNHPEALQRLFEMELRSNPKQMHPFAAGGHSQGMYSHGLDLNFGYR